MSDENQVQPEEVETFQAEVVKPPEEKASGLAITALVCGILSFCCCGMLAGIPAIIIGWVENGNINAGRSSQKGKWMAMTGLILGLISIIWTCVWVGWYFFWGGMSILSGMRP